MESSPQPNSPEFMTDIESRQPSEPSRNRKEKANLRDAQRTISRFAKRLMRFHKEIWRSILTLAVVGAATGAAWIAPHAFDRLFPVTFFTNSGDIVWAQFAYPYQQPIFSSLTVALVANLVPIGVILVSQIWIRSFCDAASAILGLSYSLVTGTFFSVVLKKTIGGLRPHFLTVCEPRYTQRQTGAGYKNIMFTIRQVCTGKDKGKIGNAIESFPSGHAEIAFAGFFYLSLYLFTHVELQKGHRVGYWRMLACLLPILLATYISSTLVLNYHHHSYDVIFGALLGIVVAFFGYRMAFKSIWDKERSAVPSCSPDCQCQEAALPR